MKTNILLGLCILLISACSKEKLNQSPHVSSTQINHSFVKVGEEVMVSAMVLDDDGDHIQYKWSTKDGTLLGDQTNYSVKWKAPDKEGVYTCKLEINDGKVKKEELIDIEVNGFIYDDFNSTASDWVVKNGETSIINKRMELQVDTGLGEGVLLSTLSERISPPYTIYMTVGMTEVSDSFSSSDKYGVLLDFFNVSADTVVKGLWFRVYPESTVKNWKLSVYHDKGNTNGWSNIDSTAYGKSQSVDTLMGAENQLKIEVLENNYCSIYSNGNLVFETSAMINDYRSGNEKPKLILDKIGVRSSNGRVFVDDVFVTKKPGIEHALIFD